MTDYTDRAAAVKAALQDYARDLEADLGKVERNRVINNPNFGDVQPMVEPGTFSPGHGENAAIAGSKLREYVANASAARNWIGIRDGLTPSELTAFQEVRSLVESFQSIDNRADAIALIATFQN